MERGSGVVGWRHTMGERKEGMEGRNGRDSKICHIHRHLLFKLFPILAQFTQPRFTGFAQVHRVQNGDEAITQKMQLLHFM